MSQQRCCFVVVATTCMITVGAGADVAWINPTGGYFSVAQNWDASYVPGPTDLAVFELASPGYTISFSLDAESSALEVSNDQVYFDLAGHTYTIGLATEIGAAKQMGGDLAIFGGTLSTTTLSVGKAQGSDGSLTVFGPTTLTVTDLMTIGAGDNGDGWFGLSQGAFTDAQGDVLIGAPAADGVLTINNAVMEIGGDLTVGGADSGHGELSVGPNGVLRTAGATTSAVDGGDGNVVISGIGARWEATGDITIGNDGLANLDVSAVGKLEAAGALTIGAAPGASATASVSGLQSAVNAQTIRVATDGDGDLLVAQNAEVLAGGEIRIGDGADGDGTTTVASGGQLHSDGALHVGPAGRGALYAIGAGTRIGSTGDDVVIGGGGPATVVISNGAGGGSDGDTQVGAGAAAEAMLIVSNASWNADGAIQVGVQSPGMLWVDRGSTVSCDVQLAAGGVARGWVIVDGPDTELTSFGSLLADGDGHVVARNHASLSVTGLAVVGQSDGSAATVEALSGATVELLNECAVADGAGAGGSVVVDGSGSLITFIRPVEVATASTATGSILVRQSGECVLRSLMLGQSGSGQASVGTDGLLAIQEAATLGEVAGSFGGLSCDGGLIRTGSASIFGADGDCEIIVSSGGRLECLEDATAGVGATSNAMIDISGTDATWFVDGILSLGQSGSTVVVVSGGAHVEVGNRILAATLAGSVADITVSGIDTVLDAGASLSANGSGETFIHLDNGTITPGCVLGSAASLDGTGHAGSVINRGTVSPGSSIGVLDVTNFGQLTTGLLYIELASLDPETGVDRIDSGNLVSAGGTLYLQPINGFQPQVGDSFEIIRSASGNVGPSTFAAVEGPGEVDVTYNADSIVVTYTAAPKLGDFDEDGVVNVLDLLVMLGAWGPCPVVPPCPEDLNADGVVNVQDLLLLLGAWG